ncbi:MULTISPECIES: LysR family transcriptional regulator [Sphingobium]|uniref:LysR family transcriptional regulator n=1 Tax=Sphingobium sp. MI1205 TaxID=407020 RepID=UPI00076FE1CA|nr:LysR family transcriptional regulator [Sphingobium sp. MI1205]AMK16870.1 LysR family transcriptional regulator [Sphingobium sp. MI1205]
MSMFRAIATFLKVVEANSFTVAARKLGLSRSAVTAHVAGLEVELGMQLLKRSGRAMVPTEAGQLLIEQAAPLVSQLEGVVDEVRQASGALSGPIRIGVPPVYAADVLVPVAVAFIESHPDIRITLIHDDGLSNLAAAGLDVSIRISQKLESTSEFRILIDRVPQRIVASPKYLAARGCPETPADLKSHNCLTPPSSGKRYPWLFEGPNGQSSVTVSGTMCANMAEVTRSAALLGHGIIIQPAYLLDDLIESGRFVSLLPDYKPVPFTVHALFNAAPRLLPSRIRAFLNFLKHRASTHPLVQE